MERWACQTGSGPTKRGGAKGRRRQVGTEGVREDNFYRGEEEESGEGGGASPLRPLTRSPWSRASLGP